MTHAFDIFVGPSFTFEEESPTIAEAGVLCAVFGAVAAVATTVYTGNVSRLLEAYVSSMFMTILFD